MTGYQTQQRNLLVSFFESHPDEALTIDEITHKMRSEQGDAAPFPKHGLPNGGRSGKGKLPQAHLSGE